MIKKNYIFSIIIFVFLCITSKAQEERLTWRDKPHHQIDRHTERYVMPEKFRSLAFDVSLLRSHLLNAPMEFTVAARSSQGQKVLTIPMPDGTSQRFSIVESPMMESGLATSFPSFKTYGGQGIDDPHAIIKISLTDLGLHAMIISPNGNVFIDPYHQFNTSDYICYYKQDLPARSFICETEYDYKSGNLHKQSSSSANLAKSHGTQLRTYRLAVAATGEYTAFYGGTVSGAMSGIVASVNRVNGVYENELAVRLTLIANNNLIVYTNSATDPYTNGNGSTMLGQNQTNIDAVIGSANYDVGHVFSTGGGGVANLGVPCTSSKARGVTGSSSPVGDAYDIDYVAHEVGHQFGGNHTFNSITGNCGGGNRAASAAYEPGSGITIMAYAGICGTDNLAPNSIAYFHTKSFDEITNFITGATGGSCPVTTSTGNTPPTVNPGSDYSIPISTPFVLTGSGTDANGDALTYSWEEYDLGTGGAWNAAQSSANDAPLFRPFPPVTTPSRTFPKLSDIINNTTTIGEFPPSVARTLDFRLTVRDNRAGGGGVVFNDVTQKVTTVATAGPFAVTAPNTAVTWGTGTLQTVTWNVLSTDLAPINCANVKISISTDGGNTFPTVLNATTPNDGSEVITVPATVSTQARIKVEAVGNIFFDMSNTNFTIQASSPVLTTITTNSPASLNLCAGSNVSISYSTDGPANAGNIFTAQLSNSGGSFASPVNIGTLSSTAAGTIACTIPGGTVQGTGYRVRVVSSNPIVTGSDNGVNISIFQPVGAAGSISGSGTVCQGQTGVAYSVGAIANATSYNWTLPGGASIASGSGTNSITVNYSAIAASGNVVVAGTNSGCGNGISSSLPVTVNTLPAAAGVVSGSSVVCQGQTGVSYSVTSISGATGYNWVLPSGATIASGSNTNAITVNYSGSASSGSITVNGTNSCGSGTSSAAFSVVVSSAPTAPIVTSGAATVCAPSTVSMSFTAAGGINYQWRKNGSNIPGETGSNYVATTSGNYDVVSSFVPVAAQTFNSTGTTSILDNSCSTLSNDIVVSGYTVNVPSSQITCTLNITHTWVGDIVILLEAPGGTQRLGLSDRTGNTANSLDNFTNTIFSDAAATTVASGTAPYTGTFKPWGSAFTQCTYTTNIFTFAALGGGSINPNGTWRLRVFDRASQDAGTINSWSISFPAVSGSCTSVSNAIAVTVNPLPSITSFNPTNGVIGSSVTINGSGFTGTTSVKFNGTNSSFTVNNDSTITTSVPAGATTGFINVTNGCGNTNSATNYTVVSTITLNLSLLIQGFHTGGGSMTAIVPLSPQTPTHTDTITVLFYEVGSYVVPFYTANAVLSTAGTCSITLPGSFNGNSYYIAIRHRNSIETWSKNPVLFNPTTNFSFKN